MVNSIETLKKQRKSLYEKLGGIGNFRRGTVSVNYRKCGKNNCACSKEGHPGHGPQYLWSTTIKGKSYTRQIKLGPQLQKYVEEIDNYHKFQHICNEIIQINEKICNLLPAREIEDATEMQELKKNLQRHFMKKYKKKLTG